MASKRPGKGQKRQFGALLAREDYPHSDRQYEWYKAVASALECVDLALALKKSGLKRAAFFEGLRRMHDTGSLDSTPRKSAPTVYTPEVMKDAYELLVTSASMLNFLDLFWALKGEGHLQEVGCIDRFRQAFTQYCKSVGTPLTVNSTQMTFYLAPKDYPERAAYATMMLNYLRKSSLEDLLWVDEVTVEEVAHPKGAHVHGYCCVGQGQDRGSMLG